MSRNIEPGGTCPQATMANLIALTGKFDPEYWRVNGEYEVLENTKSIWLPDYNVQLDLLDSVGHFEYTKLEHLYQFYGKDKKDLYNDFIESFIVTDPKVNGKISPFLLNLVGNKLSNIHSAFGEKLQNTTGLNDVEELAALSKLAKDYNIPNLEAEKAFKLLDQVNWASVSNKVKDGHGAIIRIGNVPEYLKSLGISNWNDEKYKKIGHSVLVEHVREENGLIAGLYVVDSEFGHGKPLYIPFDVLKKLTTLTQGDVLVTKKPIRDPLVAQKLLTETWNPIPLLEELITPITTINPIANIIDLFKQALGTISPLILDLDNDGVETLSINEGTYFDHNADGFSELTGWASPDDGLLVLDINDNGLIDSGRELFGEHTLLSNGEEASGGFEALAELDSNLDGKIDANDTQFSDLKIWIDANSDGITDSGELHTLGELNIESISLNFENVNKEDAEGNLISQAGSYTTTDQVTHDLSDIKFQVNNVFSQAVETIEISPEVEALPNAKGYGVVYDLHQAMERDTDGSLQTLVESFTTETDQENRLDLVDQILFEWTDSQDIDPNSRSRYFDSRKLNVLESFMAERFKNVNNYVGPNATALLKTTYDYLHRLVYSQLMVQTHLSDIFDKASVETDISGNQYINISGMIDEINIQIAINEIEGKALLEETLISILGLGYEYLFSYSTFYDTFVPLGEDYQAIFDDVEALYESDDTIVSNGQPGGYDEIIVGDDQDNIINGYGGNDDIQGMAGNDTIDGGSGDDGILGQEGDDIITGGTGNDFMDGGSGNDTYIFNIGDGEDIINENISTYDFSIDKVVFGANIAIEDLEFTASETHLIINVTISGDKLTILGQFDPAGTFTIENFEFEDGTVLSDQDVIALTQIHGTSGDDDIEGSYTNDTIYADAGNDTVSASTGDDVVYGEAGNDALYGEKGDDILIGGTGNDLLDGGSGTDQMFGGTGNDTYFVDVTSDSITENTDEGIDLVKSLATYTLGNNLENLELLGTDNLSGTGNAINNTITGNSGNNVLNGLAGIDQLAGGLGNDTYYVDDLGDTVIENTDEGYDTVRMSVSLATTNNIEKFIFTGTNDIDLTANDLDNTITANNGINVIYGGGGNDAIYTYDGDDTLYGEAGNDVLDGGTGADQLYGGLGNDTYYTDNVGDTVIELADEGYDTVRMSASLATTANIEKFIFTGTNDINLTANDLNNTITGNSGVNVIYGGGGNDAIYAYDGDDTLYGEAGNDVLDGGTGADQLYGGLGNDTYYTDNVGDTVIELADEGYDTVRMSASLTTTANIEKFIFTGTNDINLTANDLDNTITANSGVNVIYGGGGNDAIYAYDGDNTLYGEAGNDVLDGGTGADLLYGGLGNDTYYTDNVGDTVTELADEGYDTVRMSASLTTTANIEKFIFTGTNDINLTANDLDNTITANSGVNVIYGGGGNDAIYAYDGDDTLYGEAGNDVLDGGTGADLLYGGLGDDTYYTDNIGDAALENANEGYDTVRMSASLITTSHIEKFIFTGTNDIDLTANDLDNTITANSGVNVIYGGGGNDAIYAYDGDDTLYGEAGNDVLDGGTGADQLYGGLGNDTYYVDNAGDSVIENADEGYDTVRMSASLTTTANIEKFIFTGTNDINLTANDLDNTITANSGVNVIYGGGGNDAIYTYDGSDTIYGEAGNDVLDGGAGADQLYGGLGNDTYYVDNAGDSVIENADEGYDTVRMSASLTTTANIENSSSQVRMI
ncbi:MAG: calcium-binding protein, partial [Cyanobacteriota bacterium]